jgi:hypothetical protein
MQYMTVVVDRYGRVYDLSCEHPSWEASKTAKKSGAEERNIVVNAFTCPVDELDALRKRKGRPRK